MNALNSELIALRNDNSYLQAQKEKVDLYFARITELELELKEKNSEIIKNQETYEKNYEEQIKKNRKKKNKVKEI